MKLYGYWRSSATWRVRIALAHKGIAYEYVPVHLVRDGGEQHSDTYRRLNPMEQVPLLEIEEDGKVHRVAQSLAILELLEERHPTPPLLPADPFRRARARQLAEMVNSGIQPLQNLGVLQHVKRVLLADENAWAVHFIAKGLAALERTAAETAGAFLVGDSVSVADVCLVPQLYGARRYKIDLAAYPILSRVEATCSALPAFQAAHADRQPDAVTPT
jgi:maleylpyruvate isomerase